jgi:hypothetical protein
MKFGPCVLFDEKADDDLMRIGLADEEAWDALWVAIESLSAGTYDPDDLSQPWPGEVRLLSCRRGETSYKIKFRPLLASDTKRFCNSSPGFWITRIHTTT